MRTRLLVLVTPVFMRQRFPSRLREWENKAKARRRRSSTDRSAPRLLPGSFPEREVALSFI